MRVIQLFSLDHIYRILSKENYVLCWKILDPNKKEMVFFVIVTEIQEMVRSVLNSNVKQQNNI